MKKREKISRYRSFDSSVASFILLAFMLVAHASPPRDLRSAISKNALRFYELEIQLLQQIGDDEDARDFIKKQFLVAERKGDSRSGIPFHMEPA